MDLCIKINTEVRLPKHFYSFGHVLKYPIFAYCPFGFMVFDVYMYVKCSHAGITDFASNSDGSSNFNFLLKMLLVLLHFRLFGS